MIGERERVLSMINGAWTTQAIGVACELGIPGLLAKGAATPQALAAAVHADAEALHRLLRALATLELCEERADGAYALLPGGVVLTEDATDSVAPWALLSARRLWTNWAGLAESVRTGRSSRSRTEAADDFTFLNADARGAELFNRAMVAMTGPIARAAARELDWSRANTIVDVGGGTGELAATLLAEHFHLKGVVFDLDHAGAGARELIARAGLADRCRFVAGSFFESIPAGDTLILKSVLHNWPDEQAASILERCAGALLPGARVVLIERVLPETLGTGPEDRDAARSDLNMLVGCGGRERTATHFRSLLGGAGLDLQRVRPLAAGFHALEARARTSLARV